NLAENISRLHRINSLTASDDATGQFAIQVVVGIHPLIKLSDPIGGWISPRSGGGSGHRWIATEIHLCIKTILVNSNLAGLQDLATSSLQTVSDRTTKMNRLATNRSLNILRSSHIALDRKS